MKAEPLKDKELLMRGSSQAYYQSFKKKDVASAVEFLKSELLTKGKRLSRNRVKDKIDEAFADAIKKEDKE